MAIESVLNPEMKMVKQDEFYLFYEMMMQALRTDDVKEGLNESLKLLRKHLESGYISLFIKNEEGEYIYKMSDSYMNGLAKPVGCIVNKTSSLSEIKEKLDLDLNLSDRLKNMKIIHFKVDDIDYILSIVNTNKDKELEPLFYDRLKDTMQIILKRAASYEKNVKAVTTDLLTNLENRNSYEMRLQNINESDDNIVFGVFDLFRLKYINDNFTHTKGDEYIKKVADILNKYWPSKRKTINDDATETFEETGHYVYRIGGDEFVLITTVEKLPLAEIKANLAASEASMIDLGIGEKIPVGFNFGIVEHIPGDSMKNTFMNADDEMQKDKKLMYVKNNIERRR